VQDHEAIHRLTEGEITALEILVQRYSLIGLRTAFLITRDHALAEDVVQEAFMRVYDRARAFDGARPFQPWFLRIVVRTAIDAVPHGAQRVLHPREVGDRLALLSADDSLSPDDLLAHDELRREIWDAVGKLPAKQRAVVVMRYYLEFREDEMARELSIAPGTVKSRLHAARQNLRTVLRPTFLGQVR
jgi:RNA polymerase sigma-70 factor (ECF subfamily)